MYFAYDRTLLSLSISGWHKQHAIQYCFQRSAGSTTRATRTAGHAQKG